MRVSTRRAIAAAAVAVLPLLIAACDKDGEDDKPAKASVGGARLVARDSTRPLGPGDVRIVSTDSAVELAIIGDSIIGGLGQKVLDKVRVDLDTSHTAEKGIGASIANMVKGTVANALSHQVTFPVSSVEDVRFEDGGLQMYGANGSRLHIFESNDGKKHDTGGKAAFSEADAQRFIAAFHTRKAATK